MTKHVLFKKFINTHNRHVQIQVYFIFIYCLKISYNICYMFIKPCVILRLFLGLQNMHDCEHFREPRSLLIKLDLLQYLNSTQEYYVDFNKTPFTVELCTT